MDLKTTNHGDQTRQSLRKSILNIHWKDWCWSSNALATWFEELTHWKRPWYWERLKAGEGDNRGWDGWMESLTQLTWVWASSERWWGTRKPSMLQSMASQRVGHDWASKLKREKVEEVTNFTFLGSKSTADSVADMKLKDVCSLQGKLWQI